MLPECCLFPSVPQGGAGYGPPTPHLMRGWDIWHPGPNDLALLPFWVSLHSQ